MYTILVVDDDQIDRINFKRNLLRNSELGTYDILEASTGRDALKIAEGSNLHCLLLDYHLPDYTGDDFIRAFRENETLKDIPIIIMTGQSDETIAINSLKLGAKDYLTKGDLSDEYFCKTISDCIKQQENLKKIEVSHQQIKFVASHDHLTGLVNRSHFETCTKNALSSSKRHKKSFSVMFLDLDHFKYVNDTFGHDMGDSLLIEVATRLKSNFREEDIIARFGGDEFAVLLPDASQSPLLGKKAEDIINILSAPYKIKGHELNINASIGIACFPESGDTFESLLKSADLAMYIAKLSGKGTYKFHSNEINVEISFRNKIQSELNKAIEYDQLRLLFQTQIDMNSNAIVGLEALLRWDHPDYKQISPLEIIQLAEGSGLIKNIGMWVIQQACLEFKEWQSFEDNNINLLINISTIQLADKMFFSQVDEVVKKHKLNAKNINLEICENAVSDNNTKVMENLSKLKEAGFEVSIDDFGKGGSSLEKLIHLPITALKIDKDFISDLNCMSPLIKCIINLSNNFGLKVMAEGVETESQLEFLKQHGCHIVQGYYYSKPSKICNIKSNY
tara:strand:- start:60239 stop:61930 length:1692 start_codon:yes stop_codon:yes gene_type:complete